MTARDEGFLARWSRLKREGEEPPAEEPAPAPAPVEAADPPAEGEPQHEEPPELPPIETLDKDSDYTVFMREGVPEEMRRLALRKLWTSDPVYANLDGLLEYGEDFAEPFRAPGLVATLYRVGQGMPDPVKEALEEAMAEAPDAPAVADAAPEPAGEDASAAEPDRPDALPGPERDPASADLQAGASDPSRAADGDKERA